MKPCFHSLSLTLIALLVGCFYVHANPESPTLRTERLKVSIKTTADHFENSKDNLGVSAEIENISNDTVYLKNSGVTITIPDELFNADYGNGYYASFPTEPVQAHNIDRQEICLHPGDHYITTWNLVKQFDTLNKSANLTRWLYFQPGKYEFAINIKYWTDQNYKRDYHTICQYFPVDVAVSQTTILFGAVIGGLIYFFMQYVNSTKRGDYHYNLREFPTGVLKLLGNILLSIIITIILSRTNTSLFIVKLTINDFWGAIVIGFVANYLGEGLLKKMFGDPDNSHQGNNPQDTAPISS